MQYKCIKDLKLVKYFGKTYVCSLNHCIKQEKNLTIWADN